MAKKTKLPGTTTVPTSDRTPVVPSRGRRLLALGIVVTAAAVAIALVAGAGAHHHGGSPPAATVKPVLPTLFTASGLKRFAAGLNQPIYWVGPMKGDRYELTRTANNDVYVRYLPLGVDAGSRQGKYLLIATYPLYKAIVSLRATDHGHPLRVRGERGAIAVVDRGTPTSVHVAFRDVDYEVEVYDPSPKTAREVATSGSLTPVP